MNIDETKRRMHNGKIYYCNDDTLVSEQLNCLERLYDFNNTRPLEQEKRQKLMKEMFAEIGEGCYIEPPLHANWSGKFVHIGDNFYANFNLTMVDDTEIFICDNVLIGPNVTIDTGTHPIDPILRTERAQYNLPVHIESNVWIGARAVILPGVTIGENSIIGAGSVVTKDIPKNVVAVGTPCKVLREINENDKIYYEKTRRIDV